MQELGPPILVFYQNSYPGLPLETSALQEECKAQLAHDLVCPCSCSNPGMEASDTQSPCHVSEHNSRQVSLFVRFQHPQRSTGW